MVNFFWVQWDLHSVPGKARDQIELWGLRNFFEKTLSDQMIQNVDISV